MTAPIPDPTQGASQAAAQQSAANTSASAAAASSNSSQVSSSTTISSMADLKKKSPKVYNMILVSLAQTMCNQIHKQQQQLKKIAKEYGQGSFF